MIPDAELLFPGDVCVTGSVHILQLIVILALRIGVADDESDRCTQCCRLVIPGFTRDREDAAEEFHPIAFGTRCAHRCAAGSAAIDLLLDPIEIKFQSGRATIDHPTDRGAMAFTESGKAEDLAEAVATHARRK